MIHIEDLCAPEAVPEKARAILVSDEVLLLTKYIDCLQDNAD